MKKITFITWFMLFSVGVTSQAIFAQQFPAAHVNVIRIKQTELAPVVWVSGTVVSQNDAEISAEISSRLISLSAVGTQVDKGDIIAQLDDKQLQIKFTEAQAKVSNSQVHLRFLEHEVLREQQLVKKKLSAPSQLDRTISERDIAKGEVIAAKARLVNVEQDLSYTQVKAPFAGVIAQRIASLGEYVTHGSAMVRLVETTNAQASVYVPIAAYPFLQQVKHLRVESALGQGTAKIKTLVPVANPRSHLMEVRLDMSTFAWPIGLSIKAQVANGLSALALAVPRDALVLRRGGASVFRINVIGKEQKAEQIPVDVGIGMDELVSISSTKSGTILQSGDLIVIRGAERLQDGQNVAIKKNNDALVSGYNSDKKE